MLQQTQVPRVVPRYDAFIRRLPTPASCAAAPVGDVVRLWAGLGYNRRAVNLHRSAIAVVDRHQGAVPSDLDQLMALPGVGPYTARAVLAFAFEHDHGVVDTNAARVLARTEGRRLSVVEVQSRADALVPPGQAWAWNQAMLDLGATVCTKRSPKCGLCPVSEACGWRRSGFVPPDPADGSAGIPGAQSTFAGSDRQGRGRLVDAIRERAVGDDAVAVAAGWPDDPARARRIADSLVRDGLAEWDGRRLRLPH